MLMEQVFEDLKSAMKARQQTKMDTLRSLKTAMQHKMIEKKVKTLQDDEVYDILQRQVKQRKDSIEEFKKAGRNDLVDREQGQIDILMNYLPKPLTEMELNEIVKSVIAELGVSGKADMGKVIKGVIAKTKGRSDGKTVSAAVERNLREN